MFHGGSWLHKAMYSAGGVALVSALIFGRDAWSYIRTAGSSVRQAVKAEVPLDFEIQRAREMVENLVPDIRHCMHVIAEQQVDIEQMGQELGRKDQSLTDQQAAILALRSDLESGQTKFVFAGRSYSQDEVRRDLSVRFERFKVVKETVERDRKILDARQTSLKANQEKLDTMLASKKELEVQIEQFEARLKTVQAAQAVSDLQIDDTQLSRAKKLIGDLNKQLDVQEKLLDAEGKFTGLIPVEARERHVRDITGEVDRYFGKEGGTSLEPVAAPEL